MEIIQTEIGDAEMHNTCAGGYAFHWPDSKIEDLHIDGYEIVMVESIHFISKTINDHIEKHRESIMSPIKCGTFGAVNISQEVLCRMNRDHRQVRGLKLKPKSERGPIRWCCSLDITSYNLLRISEHLEKAVQSREKQARLWQERWHETDSRCIEFIIENKRLKRIYDQQEKVIGILTEKNDEFKKENENLWGRLNRSSDTIIAHYDGRHPCEHQEKAIAHYKRENDALNYQVDYLLRNAAKRNKHRAPWYKRIWRRK